MRNTIDITVGDDPDYNYIVTVHPEGYSLTYNQTGLMSSISFGSLSEMQHVANAMLSLCKPSKELSSL